MVVPAAVRPASTTSAIPARFTEEEVERMDRAHRLIGLPSRSAFIRQAVLDKLESVEGTGVLVLREVSEKEAMRMIKAYLRKRPGTHHVSDLVEELGIEPRVAFAAAQKLIDEGRAELGRE